MPNYSSVPGMYQPSSALGFVPSDFSFGGAAASNPITSGFDFGQPMDFSFKSPLATPATAPATPSALGFNAPTANLALGGLQTIGNLWAGFQAAKLAKKQFGFQKDFANENLANQIQSYNTTLADRARSRAVVEGQTPAHTQAYLDQNSLKPKTI